MFVLFRACAFVRAVGNEASSSEKILAALPLGQRGLAAACHSTTSHEFHAEHDTCCVGSFLSQGEETGDESGRISNQVGERGGGKERDKAEKRKWRRKRVRLMSVVEQQHQRDSPRRRLAARFRGGTVGPLGLLL